MNRIVNHDAPSLCEANSDVPHVVGDVVHKALARKRDDRFEDARAMALALEQAAETAGLRPSADGLAAFMAEVFGSRPYPWESSSPARVVEPAQPGTDPTRAVEAEPSPVAPPSRRRWVPWTIVGGGLAFAAGLAVWAQASARSGAPTAAESPPQTSASAPPPPSSEVPTAALEPEPAPKPAPKPELVMAPPGAPSDPAPTKPPRQRPRSKTKTKPAPKPAPKPPEPSPAFDPDGLGPVRTVLK